MAPPLQSCPRSRFPLPIDIHTWAHRASRISLPGLGMSIAILGSILLGLIRKHYLPTLFTTLLYPSRTTDQDNGGFRQREDERITDNG
jgi:hypothetical protein